jgi:hypothetical protein
MTIDGKIIEKYETQEISSSFQKREFVVEYAENPQYPEYLKFELIQSNCQQLDGFNPGDELTISFNLKGRKWTDPKGEVKYFNSLQAWRLEKKTASAPTPSDNPPPPSSSDEWMKEDFSSDDDLPF